jgi:hypothetical protein
MNVMTRCDHEMRAIRPDSGLTDCWLTDCWAMHGHNGQFNHCDYTQYGSFFLSPRHHTHQRCLGALRSTKRIPRRCHPAWEGAMFQRRVGQARVAPKPESAEVLQYTALPDYPDPAVRCTLMCCDVLQQRHRYRIASVPHRRPSAY